MEIKNYSLKRNVLPVKVIKLLIALLLSGCFSLSNASPSYAETGDSPSTAIIIAPNLKVSSSLSQWGEEWYKITIPTKGKARLKLQHGNNDGSNFTVDLFTERDEDIYWLPEFSGEENTSTTYSNYFRLPAGTFYISVSSWDAGNYSLTYEHKDESQGAYESEINDRHSSATPIILNKPITGNICNFYDKDWYIVEVPSKSEICLRIERSRYARTNYNVSAYKKEKDSTGPFLFGISRYFANGNSPVQHSEFKWLSAGTYYILVEGDFGDCTDDYTLAVQKKVPSKNAYLKKLSTSTGKWSNKFSRTCYSYTVTLPLTKSNVKLTATKDHPKAMVSWSTNLKSWSSGSSETIGIPKGKTKNLYCKVTAQSGAIKIYKVKLFRKK